MDGLEREYQGRLQVIRLDFNADRNKRAIEAMGVRVHPTVVLIDRNGQLRPLLLGPQSIDKMRPLIDELVQP